MGKRLEQLQSAGNREQGNGIIFRDTLANIFQDAFAYMLQVRQFSALSVQHQGDDISRKATGSFGQFCFSGSGGVGGLSYFSCSRESRVEKFDLLRHTVFD